MGLSAPIRQHRTAEGNYLHVDDLLIWLQGSHAVAVERQAAAETGSQWEAEARGQRMSLASVIEALRWNRAQHS